MIDNWFELHFNFLLHDSKHICHFSLIRDDVQNDLIAGLDEDQLFVGNHLSYHFNLLGGSRC